MSLTFNIFKSATRSTQLFNLTRTVLCQSKSINFVRARPCSVFSKSPDYSHVAQMDLTKFESECKRTLEKLTEYFDEIVENESKLVGSDVAYSVSLSLQESYQQTTCLTHTNFPPLIGTGRCADGETWHAARNVCDQPPNAESTNLAQFTNLWPKTLWLHRWQVDLQARWRVTSPVIAEWAWDYFHESRWLPRPVLAAFFCLTLKHVSVYNYHFNQTHRIWIIKKSLKVSSAHDETSALFSALQPRPNKNR